MQPAIQNLQFLRDLIAAVRAEQTYQDMARLRMLAGTGMGTDAMTNKQGER